MDQLVLIIYVFFVAQGAHGNNLLGFDHQLFLSPKLKGLGSKSRLPRQIVRTCDRDMFKIQCSTSYGQHLINTANKCGRSGRDYAIFREINCRQNSVGEFCGLIRNVDYSLIGSNCQSLTTCSTVCNYSLTAIVKSLGCCANQLVPKKIRNYFSRCGWAISPCQPSFNIPTTFNSRSCNRLNLMLQLYCSSKTVLLQDSPRLKNCSSLKSIKHYCGFRNGKYCIKEATTNIITQLRKAVENCPLTTNCSTSCRNSLNGLINNLGCCLKSTVAIGFQSKFAVIMNEAIWQNCGISPIEDCEVRLKEYPLATTAGIRFTISNGNGFVIPPKSTSPSSHTTEHIFLLGAASLVLICNTVNFA